MTDIGIGICLYTRVGVGAGAGVAAAVHVVNETRSINTNNFASFDKLHIGLLS